MQRRSFDQNRYANGPAYTVNQPEKPVDNTELLDQLYRYQKLKQRRVWRKSGFVLLTLLLVGFLTWQGYNYYLSRQLASQIPVAIRQSIGFPVYIPSGNYRTNDQSYVNSNDILSFKVTGNGNEFMFSEQALPADFVLSNYTNGIGISEHKEITTSNGKALLGKVLNKNILIVSTQKTLITVTSSADMGSLESLAHSLSKI